MPVSSPYISATSVAQLRIDCDGGTRTFCGLVEPLARPARAGYGLVCHFVGQCEKPEKSHCFPCRHVRLTHADLGQQE